MDILNDMDNNRTMASVDSHTPLRQDIFDPSPDLEDLTRLDLFLENSAAPALLLGPDGEQIPLPVPVYEILRQTVAAMRNGNSVRIEPLDRRLTTQQAADFLGISRSTLLRLLIEDELPYEQFGKSRHRRLRLHDVMAYRDRKRVDRRTRLDELTRQGQEDGLYDVDANAYRQALKGVRKGQ